VAINPNPLCDRCGTEVVPEPELGDEQGQTVELSFAAYSQRMDLCKECLKPLLEWRNVGNRHLRGSLTAAESLPYMPILDDD
jgi:hypothetical protein